MEYAQILTNIYKYNSNNKIYNIQIYKIYIYKYNNNNIHRQPGREYLIFEIKIEIFKNLINKLIEVNDKVLQNIQIENFEA